MHEVLKTVATGFSSSQSQLVNLTFIVLNKCFKGFDTKADDSVQLVLYNWFVGPEHGVLRMIVQALDQ